MKKVLVGGVFNILHAGHIFFLEEAKRLGDFFVVVVANDKTVLNGKGYLLSPMRDRKRMIESIKFVDRVVIGDCKDFFRVVKKERPDIIALGFDQKIDVKGLEEVTDKNKLNIKIVRIGKFRNYSTRKIMGKIKNK